MNFIGFCSIHGHKHYELIGVGSIHGPASRAGLPGPVLVGMLVRTDPKSGPKFSWAFGPGSFVPDFSWFWAGFGPL
jgi:hypothetical protein